MKRLFILVFFSAIVASANVASASLLAVLGDAGPGGANDAEALFWLQTYAGASPTDLNLIVKENIGGTIEGPGSGGWTLTADTRSGTWTLDSSDLAPEYYFVKFGQLIAVYSYDGPGSSPYSDSFDLDAEVYSGGTLFTPIIDYLTNTVMYPAGPYSPGAGNPNTAASVSHVSVHGSESIFMIPEPGTLAIWAVGGLLGFAGLGRRRSVTR